MSQPAISVRSVLKRVGGRVAVGPVLDLSAQVAFYAVLALAPFLVVLTSLAAYVPSPNTVQRLLGRARAFMPPEAYELVANVVQDVVSSRSAALFTVGLVTALWSASRAANALRIALNGAHRLRDGRSWLRQQWVAIALTLGGAVLLLLSVVASLLGASAIEAIAVALGVNLDSEKQVWSLLRWPVAVGSLAALAALCYRVLPDTRPSPRSVLLGSMVATGLFLISSRVFTLYAENFGNFGPTYGSLTGGVLLLLWAWLSAVAFIVGGEVTAAIPGSRPRRPEDAKDVAPPLEGDA